MLDYGRSLEVFIGISDCVLSEIVIGRVFTGDMTALKESLGQTSGLSR